MPMPSQKTVETDALRIQMIQRGLTVEALARACGVKRTTLSNAIAENVPGRRLRVLVEDAFKQPVWSTLADFEARQQLARQCGFNPVLLSLSELRRYTGALKLRGRSRIRRKAALIALLQNHFTKNTKTPNPIPPE